MGGHDRGDLASAMAVQRICTAYYADSDDEPRGALSRALNAANAAIYAAGRADPSSMRAMGTTAVCAVIRQNQLVLAHVGDSRAYRIRDGQLTQLTADHDWVTDQVQRHNLSRIEAKAKASQRGAHGVLLRALGVQPDVQPDIVALDWRVGDVLLLCSDGL